MTTPVTTRCGFVALVGAPNAGKSTLLNQLVGQKVSIVSPKVQTTRTRVRGIVTDRTTQMVFIDTPGIFRPERSLEKTIVREALRALGEVDVVAFVIEAHRPLNPHVLEKLKTLSCPCVAVLNKTDKLEKDQLLKKIRELEQMALFQEVFCTQATLGKGVADLKKTLRGYMPEGPWCYDEGQVSDQSQRFLAAEITREKLFFKLGQELPYSVMVETTGLEVFRNKDIKIDQTIYVSRASHKKMILGKGGALTKSVRVAAQKELSALLKAKVHLFLHLKVVEDWQEKPHYYALMGLDFTPRSS